MSNLPENTEEVPFDYEAMTKEDLENLPPLEKLRFWTQIPMNYLVKFY